MGSWRAVRMRGAMSVLLCVVVATPALVLVMTPAEAWADAATEARFHFERGKALAAKKKWTDALEHFFESNRLAANPNAVINIAYCLEELKRFDEAFVFFEEFAALPALTESDRKEVDEALARIGPKLARLRVETKPAGAIVFLDRKALGSFGASPKTIAFAPGKHTIIAELAGHEGATAEVTLETGTEALVRLELRRITGRVRVTSPVPGARVHVDYETGSSAGTTPMELTLAPGDHTLFAKAEGYRTALTRVHVPPDGVVDISLAPTPLPAPAGTVRATATVTGAEVLVDDVPFGFAPMLRDDVPVGTHTLTFRAPEHRPWSTTLEVGQGDRIWVRADLAPKPKKTALRWLPIPIFAAAGASLVAGGIVGGFALAARADYRSAETPTVDMLEEGRRLNLGADVAFGVALVAAATGLVVYLVSRRERPRDSAGEVVVEARGVPTEAVPVISDAGSSDSSSAAPAGKEGVR